MPLLSLLPQEKSRLKYFRPTGVDVKVAQLPSTRAKPSSSDSDLADGEDSRRSCAAPASGQHSHVTEPCTAPALHHLCNQVTCICNGPQCRTNRQVNVTCRRGGDFCGGLLGRQQN